MSRNPYGNFSAPTSQVVLAGTGANGAPVIGEARNFGTTRTGSLQQSGSGQTPTGRSLASGHGERLWSERPNSNGDYEINASSKKEFIEKISHLLDGFNNGGGNQGQQGGRLFERQITPETRQARAQAIAQLAANPDGPAFRIMGQLTGDEVYETMGREGFGRQCMMVQDVPVGDVARVKVHKKDISAQVSTTSINANKQLVRQHWVYPGSYYIKAFVSIEEGELANSGPELLDAKFQDMLEQHMVKEDLYIKGTWDDQIGIINSGITYNTFTPLLFSQGCISIDQHGIPATRAVMAWDLWSDIRGQPEFANWFDPVHKHALIFDGKLGSILNVQLLTDGFRYDTLRVIEDGEIYFLGPQITVGVITQRIPVQTRPTDRYNVGQAERGWFSFQYQGTVSFPRGVNKGTRI